MSNEQPNLQTVLTIQILMDAPAIKDHPSELPFLLRKLAHKLERAPDEKRGVVEDSWGVTSLMYDTRVSKVKIDFNAPGFGVSTARTRWGGI